MSQYKYSKLFQKLLLVYNKVRYYVKNELFQFRIITKVEMYNECTFDKINVQCAMYQ